LGYLTADSRSVRVCVEWLHTCLLFQSAYDQHDDVARLQAFQMRQEIANLRLENDLLEQRLLSSEVEAATAGVSGAVLAPGEDAILAGARRRRSRMHPDDVHEDDL